MSITITCALLAGLSFSAPEGYQIEKVHGPEKKVERKYFDGTISISSMSVGCEEPSKNLTIVLKQVGRGKEEIVLPPGCTGEATTVRFSAPKEK